MTLLILSMTKKSPADFILLDTFQQKITFSHRDGCHSCLHQLQIIHHFTAGNDDTLVHSGSSMFYLITIDWMLRPRSGEFLELGHGIWNQSYVFTMAFKNWSITQCSALLVFRTSSFFILLSAIPDNILHFNILEHRGNIGLASGLDIRKYEGVANHFSGFCISKYFTAILKPMT